MIDIICSIVIYKTPIEELKKAIQSVLKSKLKLKVYIVDNSPSPINITNCFKDDRIEYIFTGKNLGFGEGHNIIWKKNKQQTKYYLILNADVYFGEDVLEKLYKFMESNIAAVGIMPRVLYKNGSIQHLCKLLPTPFDLIIRRFLPKKLHFLVGKKIDKYELKNLPMDKPSIVPTISGCCMFLNTSLISDKNLFDKRYFMYLEDTDLCRRMSKKGLIYFYPLVYITHGYEKGSYKNWKLLSYHIMSAIKYFNKWGWLFDRERKLINKNFINNTINT